MAFTAGASLAVGAVADETDWNNYYGTDGSLKYLKDEADKIDLCSMSANLAGGTRVAGTAYQNTSGKVRFVSVTAEGTDLGSPAFSAYVELADATPDVVVQTVDLDDSTTSHYGALFFVVPPNAYYSVSSSATITLHYWYEWDWC
jgi:hypothetical protein